MYDVGEEYLEYGVSSPEVMELQWFLKDQGCFPERQECTMFFGPVTEAALIKWQRSVNVPATGGFGSQSRAAFLDVLEEAGIGCASGTQTEKTATSVQEAAPPHAHVRPISSPLAWGLAGVLLVSLFIKGYNVLVQSARRRKAEMENLEVLQLDRAEQRRRYKSALNTDRNAPPAPEPPRPPAPEPPRS